jgi:hypothetical protein
VAVLVPGCDADADAMIKTGACAGPDAGLDADSVVDMDADAEAGSGDEGCVVALDVGYVGTGMVAVEFDDGLECHGAACGMDDAGGFPFGVAECAEACGDEAADGFGGLEAGAAIHLFVVKF